MGSRLGQALAAFRIGQPCCGSPSLLRSVVSLGLLGQMPTLWLLEDQKLSPHSLGSRPALSEQAWLVLPLPASRALLGNCLPWLTAGQFQSVPGVTWQARYVSSCKDASFLGLGPCFPSVPPVCLIALRCRPDHQGDG